LMVRWAQDLQPIHSPNHLLVRVETGEYHRQTQLLDTALNWDTI
jgi:hypothetical protein